MDRETMSEEPRRSALLDLMDRWFRREPGSDEPGEAGTLIRYRRLWLGAVLSSCLVSLLPLFIMFLVNYTQYHKAFSEEVKHPIRLNVSTLKRTLEFFFEERRAALSFIVQERSAEELSDAATLRRVFDSMRDNFGGVVDLGLIDARGIQRSYVGPYMLQNRNYADQGWFRATLDKGADISDVFMGYRRYPHFAIAVRGERAGGGEPYVLRATLNAAILGRLIRGRDTRGDLDTFIVNRAGVLQTPSARHGGILRKAPFPVPPAGAETRVVEEEDEEGGVRVTGHAYIPATPFVLLSVVERASLLRSWFALRNELVVFLLGSAVLIVAVVLAGSSYMVGRLKEVDTRRCALLHQVEYTSKMASIGRLAAGVAHEVNNPLAIINEKAGLLRDIIELDDSFPQKERFLRHVGPIQSSVERCARITRRLLRFAKHIDIEMELIELGELIPEVLGFLEKESAYRSLSVKLEVEPGVPTIRSDRGRLQQVFLNIINNAFAAVPDGGEIAITVSKAGTSRVAVRIRDNGIGIPQTNLSKVFEPFFTTKQKYGTGLGLSITYGIVAKLGGTVLVDSVEGEWTEFTVVLPVDNGAQGVAHARA